MIKAGQDIVDSDFIFTVVAGENLTVRDSIYIDASDGKAYKTDADDLNKLVFRGFATETVSSGANALIRHDGQMTGFSGLTIGATYYVSGTAGAITTTRPSNFKVVGVAMTASVIKITKEYTKRKRIYTTPKTIIGSSTTQFDITNPAGTTFRYTWDTTGTDPSLSAANNPVGSTIIFQAQNFTSANNGTFIVTGSGSNYVEVTNASGVAENNKTIGTGYAARSTDAWVKTPGTIRIEVETVGGGGNGQNERDSDSGARGGTGGGAGAYVYKQYYLEDLVSSVGIEVGGQGQRSSFGNYLTAGNGTDGGDDGGSGGSASGGDINIGGGGGCGAGSTSGGVGGSNPFGFGGRGSGTGDANGGNASGYGGGGGGAAASSTPSGSGGSGTQGIIIITEYY